MPPLVNQAQSTEAMVLFLSELTNGKVRSVQGCHLPWTAQVSIQDRVARLTDSNIGEEDPSHTTE